MTQLLTIPAELAELANVRAWVVERLNDAEVPAPACVDIEMSTEGEIVRLVITDDGPPWDGTMSAPAPDGRGGYGVPLIEEVMDRVEHTALDPSGNRLTLEKRLTS